MKQHERPRCFDHGSVIPLFTQVSRYDVMWKIFSIDWRERGSHARSVFLMQDITSMELNKKKSDKILLCVGTNINTERKIQHNEIYNQVKVTVQNLSLAFCSQ